MRGGLIALVLFGFADAALACGVCVMAEADAVLPPIRVWSLFAAAWFLAHGALRTATGASLPLQPRLGGSVAIAFAALLGTSFLGPLTMLPLAIPPLVAVVRRPAIRKQLRWSATIAAVVVAALAVWSVHERRTRTEAELIAEWSATSLGRRRFEALRAKEPASLPTYRELLRIGDPTLAVESARRIAAIGDPRIDLPLLEQAVGRFGAADSVAEELVQLKHELRMRHR